MKNYTIIFSVSILLLLAINILITSVAFPDQNYNVTDNFNKLKSLFPDEDVMLIVDFSDSMNEFLGNKRKIDIAMENIAAILPFVPQNIKIGLRVYGHKSGFTVYQACTASEMLVPPAKNSVTAVSNKLYSLKPQGVTPITYSLKKCIEKDFIHCNGKKHIVLISDGKENCDESPCKFAIELMKKREDVVIDVIALGIDDPEAITQLKCAALTTSGKFFWSDTSAQLLDSLKNSLYVSKDVQGQIILK